MRSGVRPSGSCRVLLVTNNDHKVEEARAILAPYGIRVEKAGIPKLELQSDNLETIALVAASHAYAILREPILVDDSGLFVEALRGFPGPYSSYVYKTIGYNGILKLLENVENRNACFRTALAYAGPGQVQVFTGEVCGRIAYEARGSQGFGFDPVFIPEGFESTFAELGPEDKNKISHRGEAFRAFAEWYLTKCGAGGGI